MRETVHFLYISVTKAVSYQHTGLITDLAGHRMRKNRELNQLVSGLRLRSRKLMTFFWKHLTQWMATGTLVVRPVKFSANWNLEENLMCVYLRHQEHCRIPEWAMCARLIILFRNRQDTN